MPQKIRTVLTTDTANAVLLESAMQAGTVCIAIGKGADRVQALKCSVVEQETLENGNIQITAETIEPVPDYPASYLYISCGEIEIDAKYIVSLTSDDRWIIGVSGETVLPESTEECLPECNPYAIVIEPLLPMRVKGVKPNFAQTTPNGDKLSNKYDDSNYHNREDYVSYHNARSAGLVAIEGKEYHPIQARYQGGEGYEEEFEEETHTLYRTRGELMFADTERTKPVYLKRRYLKKSEPSWWAEHRNIADSNGENRTSKRESDKDSGQLYTNSPFLYLYGVCQRSDAEDDAVFADNIPIAVDRAYPADWETTENADEAQLDWDIAVSPYIADGEVLVVGERVRVRKTFVEVKTLATDIYGQWKFKSNGEGIDGKYRTEVFNYCEAEPVIDEYLCPLLGQGDGKAELFTIADDKMTKKPLSALGEKGVYEFLRLKYADQFTPQFVDEEKICRDDFTRYPAIAVFVKTDSNGVRYPCFAEVRTADGYGIPVAVEKTIVDADGKCGTVLEYIEHSIKRENGHLYLYPSVCYEPCSNIEGVSAPALRDPSTKPFIVIFNP